MAHIDSGSAIVLVVEILLVLARRHIAVLQRIPPLMTADSHWSWHPQTLPGKAVASGHVDGRSCGQEVRKTNPRSNRTA